jgi:tetratricopeptide (TPR) repeat protein
MRFQAIVVAGAPWLVACAHHVVSPQAARNLAAGVAYLSQGEWELAEERCRLALEYDDAFPEAYNCLGIVALKGDGDVERAIDLFKAALARNDDFAEAHNNLGTCFMRRVPADYGIACEELKASLEIDPGYLDARENYGQCLVRRGTVLGDKGDIEGRARAYKEARSHLLRLLEMKPSSAAARNSVGFMELTEKKYAAAELSFKRCLEIDPAEPACSYNLGNTYLATSRCEDAIRAFVSALRSGERTDVAVGARQNLGVAYAECARKDGAIAVLLDQIARNPGDPSSHYDLAGVYKRKGLLERAVGEWESTIALEPSYCPAHFELAMHANDLLDAKATVERCQSFVTCASDQPRWRSEIDRCKELVKRLLIE